MCSKGSFEEGPINKAKVKEMEVKEEGDVGKEMAEAGIELTTLGL